MEVGGNNRSVMPLDVLGRTRATLTEPASLSPWPEGLGNLVKLCRAGDRALQLLLFNEEFLVGVSHQLASITSLPFVHTARRYYGLNGLFRCIVYLLIFRKRMGNNATLLVSVHFVASYLYCVHPSKSMGNNETLHGTLLPSRCFCEWRFETIRKAKFTLCVICMCL